MSPDERLRIELARELERWQHNGHCSAVMVVHESPYSEVWKPERGASME
ncbi:MAG: hypothetical protein ACE5IG_06610 [Dehalococcoidia bacterium]